MMRLPLILAIKYIALEQLIKQLQNMKTLCLLGSRAPPLNVNRGGNQSEENIVEEDRNNALYEECEYPNDPDENDHDDGDDGVNEPDANAHGHDFRQHCF